MFGEADRRWERPWPRSDMTFPWEGRRGCACHVEYVDVDGLWLPAEGSEADQISPHAAVGCGHSSAPPVAAVRRAIFNAHVECGCR